MSEAVSNIEKPARAANPKSREPRLPLARIIRFLVVALAITLGATEFVGATWNHFWRVPAPWVWLVAAFALTLAFFATTIAARKVTSPFLGLAYHVSAIWIGLLNYGFFAACGAWVVWGALHVFSISMDSRIIALGFVDATLVASLYGLFNASVVRVTRRTVLLADLPESWHGREVALATDWHLGNIRAAGYARRVVNQLRELRPHAIFISGDLYDGSVADFDAIIAPLKDLSAPAGVYYVSGNHEEYAGRAKVLGPVSRAGVRVLDNEKVEADGLQIVGIHDAETNHPRVYRSLLQRANLDGGRASVLLAHQPVNLHIAAEAGISLQLSGHTHGGQIWPWTWVARRTHGRFNYGLNHFGPLQVFTSYGAGTWGVPMRVGTKSEIVLLRLEPADAPAPKSSVNNT